MSDHSTTLTESQKLEAIGRLAVLVFQLGAELDALDERGTPTEREAAEERKEVAQDRLAAACALYIREQRQNNPDLEKRNDSRHRHDPIRSDW
jgi:hypothetical protein